MQMTLRDTMQFAVLASALVAPVAHAADFANCTDIADDRERLACFDHAAKGVDDHGDSIETAGAVMVHGSTGEIEHEGDVDWFAVRLEAGKTYWIDLKGESSGTGTLRDPYLEGVYDANGDLFSNSWDDDGGPGNDSRLSFTAPEDGTYYVAVGSEYNLTGTYEVTVTDASTHQAVGFDCGGYLTTTDIPEIAHGDWQKFWRTPDLLNLRYCIKAYGLELIDLEFRGTPLHIAALFSSEPTMITLMVDEGADIHARGKMRGMTPLHAAASNGNIESVEVLLRLGANIEARDDNGNTPLHSAAHFSHSHAVVEVLLRAGADIEARNGKGLTPLLVAEDHSHDPLMVEVLLRAGADIEARDDK